MKSVLQSSTPLTLVIFVHLSCKRELSCEECQENNKPPIAISVRDQAITLPSEVRVFTKAKNSLYQPGANAHLKAVIWN